jgi:hypothetical protein
MTGEMQDDSWIAWRWTLILAMAVMFADSPRSLSKIVVRVPAQRPVRSRSVAFATAVSGKMGPLEASSRPDKACWTCMPANGDTPAGVPFQLPPRRLR